jgi:predicted phage terminase large subunit-like protein
MGMARNGIYYVIDVVRRQEDSLGVDKLVEHTANTDKASAPGTTHIIQQEPGSAGLAYAEHFTRYPLRGHSYEIETLSGAGNKWVRAKPMSAAAKAGNVKVVKGPWNRDFFDEAEAFGPDDDKYAHDDIVDALSSAFNWFANHQAEIGYTSGRDARPLGEIGQRGMSERDRQNAIEDQQYTTGGRKWGPGAW